MKVTIDTKTGEAKINGKLIKDASENNKQIARIAMDNTICNNYPLSEYEMDCMWMSYRYCIGRHTIASHIHAGDIWKHCKGRISDERQIFNAYDINREIEQKLAFINPNFYFPITSLNRIYTSAIDIFCEFLIDYDIKSKEDLIKYRDVHIILSDNERGYKIETVTWEEWLRPQVTQIFREYYSDDCLSEDKAFELFNDWKNGINNFQHDLDSKLMPLIKYMPGLDNYYFNDIEDLFVWNDLVHCFDWQHHHKSILTDGTECEWFWSWTNNSELHDDGYYYRTFGYHKIRVPLNDWNGNVTTWIPDESIKEDIY